MPTPKELYEIHKGKKAINRSIEGIVCGYDDTNLVIAVTSNHAGWVNKDAEHHKNLCIDNKYFDNPRGFIWILEEHVI